MATGDNFDTTKPGKSGGLTGRKSGHGLVNQVYMGNDPDGPFAPQGFFSDDNLNHPCNAGCGCAEVGKFNARTIGETGCLLPPELTIKLAASSSRDYARQAMEIPTNEGTAFKTFHLKYHNGAWRGRKCCDVDNNYKPPLELCDPCEVTTHLDGSKSECSYFGKEGTGRQAPVGIPDNPRFITSRLEVGSRLGMCFDAAGNPYENTESTQTGQMGEDSCLDPAEGGAANVCLDDQGDDVTDQFPDRQSCEANTGYSFTDGNSWNLIGQRGCIENGGVVPKKDPHCYFLDPDLGSSVFDDPLPTGWLKADDTLDNEASCERGDALGGSGEGAIGRCVCVRGCEDATHASVDKAQDEIWDSTPEPVFPKKTESDPNEPPGCLNRFQLCTDSSNNYSLEPSHTSRDSCLTADPAFRWVDDEFIYGRREWYQAQCVSFDAANARDEDKSPDGWRLAKDCERKRGSGYFPSDEAENVFEDVIFEKYECMSSGVCWDKQSGENLSESEDLVDKRDCLLEGDCTDSQYDDQKHECLNRGEGYTEKNEWKPNIWTTKWLNNVPDDSGCCSGAAITEEKSGAHQPAVGARVAGQDTCVNCYEEVILMDVSDMNTSLLELQASEGVGPDEMGADGFGRGQGQFALVWRGCDFCKTCEEQGTCHDVCADGLPCGPVIDPDIVTKEECELLSPGGWKTDQGGGVKVLFLPLDQILNCSDMDLQRRFNWDLATFWANPRGFRPPDKFACYDTSCGGKPQVNLFSGCELGGLYDDAYPDQTSCEAAGGNWAKECDIFLYHEGAAAVPSPGIEPNPTARSILHPGEYRSIALNMQAQPYKLTESKQCNYKSYAQARADQGAISACLDLSCEIKDLPYWFDNDMAAPFQCFNEDGVQVILSDLLGKCTDRNGNDLNLTKGQCLTNNPPGVWSPGRITNDAECLAEVGKKGRSVGLDWCPAYKAQWDTIKNRQGFLCSDGNYDNETDCDDNVGRCLIGGVFSHSYKNRTACQSNNGVWHPGGGWAIGGVCLGNKVSGEDCCGNNLHPYCNYCGPCAGDLEGLVNTILNDQTVRFPSLKPGSLDYWDRTGLYPECALSSYLSETCYGTEKHGTIEFASNTKPIVIKSSGHGLVTGDAIRVDNVSGNFAANVLTVGQVSEIQWDMKKGQKCEGTGCSKIANPKDDCVTYPWATPPGKEEPLPIWLVDVLDDDHFAIKDCNGRNSDGRVQYPVSTIGCNSGVLEAGSGYGTTGTEADPLTQTSGSQGEVPVWETCPYTGRWELYVNPAEILGAGPSTTMSGDEGWHLRGFGFFRQNDQSASVQDWYVDISPTEVCPTCCDHWMPGVLTATVIDPTTSILDYKCGVDCNGDEYPAVEAGYMGTAHCDPIGICLDPTSPSGASIQRNKEECDSTLGTTWVPFNTQPICETERCWENGDHAAPYLGSEADCINRDLWNGLCDEAHSEFTTIDTCGAGGGEWSGTQATEWRESYWTDAGFVQFTGPDGLPGLKFGDGYCCDCDHSCSAPDQFGESDAGGLTCGCRKCSERLRFLDKPVCRSSAIDAHAQAQQVDSNGDPICKDDLCCSCDCCPGEGKIAQAGFTWPTANKWITIEQYKVASGSMSNSEARQAFLDNGCTPEAPSHEGHGTGLAPGGGCTGGPPLCVPKWRGGECGLEEVHTHWICCKPTTAVPPIYPALAPFGIPIPYTTKTCKLCVGNLCCGREVLGVTPGVGCVPPITLFGPQNWYIKGTDGTCSNTDYTNEDDCLNDPQGTGSGVWTPDSNGESGQEGCMGFFNYRDLKCEEAFICVDLIPGAHECKSGGVMPDPLNPGGDPGGGNTGDLIYNTDLKCYGIPNPRSSTGHPPHFRCPMCNMAIVTACDHFKRKVQPGCPGLGPTDVTLTWEGYKYLSQWTPLYGDMSSQSNFRRMDSFPDTGCLIPPFVGGMQCHHHKLPEWIEKGMCINQRPGYEEIEVPITDKTACLAADPYNIWREPWHPPFCQGAECNFCGDCETQIHHHNKPPGPSPCPSPESSAYYIQLELGCGNSLDSGGHGYPTFDSYYEHGLNLKANMVTCRYNSTTNQPCPNPLECGNTIPQMGTIVPHRGIPGHNCGPTLPCTECCDFVRPGECYDTQGALTDIFTEAECSDPFGNGLVTYNWSPRAEDGCGRCATFGADVGACLDLQGQVPSSCTHRAFRKKPEVFEVIDVQYAAGPKIPETDEYSDVLTARSMGGRPCIWFEGDEVSIGLADRTAAETGGKYFHSNNAGNFTEEEMYPSSTDILSASSEYPGSTYLVVPTSAEEQDYGCNEGKKIAIDMPGREAQPTREGELPPPDIVDFHSFFEFYVADATKLTGHNRSINRHLFRGYLDTRVPPNVGQHDWAEPWPYGDQPYPTPRQSQSTVPSSSVFHYVSKALIGPLTNMWRIGVRATLSNVLHPEHVLKGLDPIVDPDADMVVPAPINLPPLEDGYGGGHLNAIKSIEEVWEDVVDPPIPGDSDCGTDLIFVPGPQFQYIKIETTFPHDLIDGEQIVLDGIWSNEGQCTFDRGVVTGLLIIPKVTCRDHNGDFVGTVALTGKRIETRAECEAETNKCYEGVCRDDQGKRVDVAVTTAVCEDEHGFDVGIFDKNDCTTQGYTWNDKMLSEGQCLTETNNTGSWNQEVLINDNPLGSTTNKDVCESQPHRTWVEGSFVDEGFFTPKACYDQDNKIIRDPLSTAGDQISEKNINPVTDDRYNSQECANNSYWPAGTTSTTWEDEKEYLRCFGSHCAKDSLQLNHYTTIEVDKDYCLSSTFGLCKNTDGNTLVLEDEGWDILTEERCKELAKKREETYEWFKGPGEWENSGFFVQGCISEEVEGSSVIGGGEAPDDNGDEDPADPGAGAGVGGGDGGGDDSFGTGTEQPPETTGNCNKCYMRCIQRNMFFDSDGRECDPQSCCGREDFCPSSELNGEWVVKVIDSTHFIPMYPVFAEPEHPLKSQELKYDDGRPTDPINTKDDDATWNDFAKGHPYGHEVGIGKSGGSFGEFYERVGTCVKEVRISGASEDVNLTHDYPTKSLCEGNNPTGNSDITYVWNDAKEVIQGVNYNGDWTRHGGVFRIVVGSHDGTPWPGMDCMQAGTEDPVDLDFWFPNIAEKCCNIHTPLEDNACSDAGYPGYGPSSNISESIDGAALYVNIHDFVPPPEPPEEEDEPEPEPPEDPNVPNDLMAMVFIDEASPYQNGEGSFARDIQKWERLIQTANLDSRICLVQPLDKRKPRLLLPRTWCSSIDTCRFPNFVDYNHIDRRDVGDQLVGMQRSFINSARGITPRVLGIFIDKSGSMTRGTIMPAIDLFKEWYKRYSLAQTGVEGCVVEISTSGEQWLLEAVNASEQALAKCGVTPPSDPDEPLPPGPGDPGPYPGRPSGPWKADGKNT